MVIDRQTLERHVEANPGFQVGAFWNGKLIGAVTTARFDKSKLAKNAHYDVVRRQADPNGDTLACFIIPMNATRMTSEDRKGIRSALKQLDLLEGVRKKSVGAAILKKVAQIRAEQRVKHLKAASTPKDIAPIPPASLPP